MQQIIEQVLNNFQLKNYIFDQKIFCPKLLQWLIQKLQRTRNFCEKNKLYTINTSLNVLQWLSCQDLAMILTSVPCTMFCHDLDKGTMVNHDLARFITMIMARVPWLRTLGPAKLLDIFRLVKKIRRRLDSSPLPTH